MGFRGSSERVFRLGLVCSWDAPLDNAASWMDVELELATGVRTGCKTRVANVGSGNFSSIQTTDFIPDEFSEGRTEAINRRPPR